ncbi:MAG: hypothetical protein CMJ78_05795 [Planctomycetaceae bacterium]|nr:hypothetical protein [Planctomycetaceae bacterium]
MSEKSGDDQVPVSSDSVTTQTQPAKQALEQPADQSPTGFDAAGRRIDAAHSAPKLAGINASSSDSTTDGEAASEITPVGRDVAGSAAFTNIEDEFLTQASQIADHLRQQFIELGRREQSLSAQLVQFDKEQRNLRLWAQEFEEDAKERDENLRVQEQQIAKQLEDSSRRSSQMDEREAELTQQFNELTLERQRMRGEILEEMQGQREELERETTRINQESNQLTADRQEFDAFLTQQQDEITQRRDELDTKFESHCEAMRTEITTEAMTEELRIEREQFEQEREQWEAKRTEEVEELNATRERQEEAIIRSLDEISVLRQNYRVEIDEWKNAQEQALVQERDRFETGCRERELELRQEKAIFENRIRFQQDHLDKSRSDFEADQNQFRHEVQSDRSRLEQDRQLFQFRMRQIQRLRILLEEREQSVDRQHELLAKSQLAFEQWDEEERKRLEAEREAWAHERQSQKTEIQRQQDIMSLHAENLESRRLRLDQLRTELEETHRNTLEMRMALEEAWAQFCQATGDDAARVRVEVARQALSDHYRNLRESLAQDRKELEASKTAFSEQKANFHSEQQTLTEWIGERDDRLQQREAELANQSAEIEHREVEWRAASDRWLREKLEAESVIRDLLQQLTDANDAEPLLNPPDNHESGRSAGGGV